VHRLFLGLAFRAFSSEACPALVNVRRSWRRGGTRAALAAAGAGRLNVAPNAMEKGYRHGGLGIENRLALAQCRLSIQTS
jgi:hypothetical protein